MFGGQLPPQPAYARDARGQITVMFALALVPSVFMMGSSVDLSRAIDARSKVSLALDAGALAAAKSWSVDVETLANTAESFLDANLNDAYADMVSEVSVVVEDDRLIFDAQVVTPTAILSGFGVPAVVTPVHVEVVRSTKKVELALVLDNTGSMGGSGKIEALRVAAHDLVEMLFGPESAADKLKVAVVPYVTSVNIRGEGFSMDWMDLDGEAEHHGTNFSPRANHFDLFAAMDVEWKGCVEMQAAPYDLLDAPPSDADPDTKWTPYLWPDEPEPGGSGRGYANDYIYDDEDYCVSCGGLNGEALRIAQQKDVAKFAQGVDEHDENPTNTSGPNKSCAAPIVPLINRAEDVLAAIDGMQPWNSSGTNGAAGLSWGWRVLSPGEPYTQGSAYDDPEVEKVLVMMTDGENFVVNQDSPNKSDYNGYSYMSQERLDTSSSNTGKKKINERMATLCDRIKAEGITIYTVVFKQSSNELKNLYRECASDESKFFDSTTNDSLIEHFAEIGSELSELRLAR